MNAQTELVFVFFKDKPNKAAFYNNPLSELSQKALDRRNNRGVALNDQDAPIEPSYIQNIKDLGFPVTDQSKWLNGVAVNATSEQIEELSQQSFVDHVESFVRNPNGGIRQNKIDKFKNSTLQKLTGFNYGNSDEQIAQINLKPLHENDFTGKNISIAVIDTGFPYVDTGDAFKRMRDNNHIKATYNFVTKNENVYDPNVNPHGAMCLGIIGGYIADTFVGSAPDADFYLYASEKGDAEIPEEQLYWIEAAEEADRQGVDVISTSLGYSEFDDSRYDYTYADMNGTTTFISRGAQIASEKGIFVLIAAGNEGQNNWHYITAPADNASVFTIGAVTSSGNSSGFSSFGPNASGVVKPDAGARGTDTYYVFNDYSNSGNGTSFATPLAAGGVACLLQAIDKTTNIDSVKDLLRQKSSLYPNPSDQMGYGILNFGKTYQDFLTTSESIQKSTFKIFPNPNNGEFFIESKEISPVKIFDMNGRIIYSGTLSNGKNPIRIKATVGNYIISTEKNGKNISEKLMVK